MLDTQKKPVLVIISYVTNNYTRLNSKKKANNNANFCGLRLEYPPAPLNAVLPNSTFFSTGSAKKFSLYP